MTHLRLITIAAAVSLLATACGGEDEPEPEPQPKSICEDFETPYDDIKIGLVKAGDKELVQVELVTLTPAKPTEDEENTWTVKLMDMSDAPMPDAQIMEVQPFMPDHGHGSQELPMIGDVNADGEVDVTNIYFQMPGVWTVTFTVDDGSGATDKVTFGVCIDS